MRAEARRNRESLTRVAGAVGSARWRGHDAERFKGIWGRCERAVRAATDGLDRAAEDLERDAGEQLRASAAVGDTTSGTANTTPVAPHVGLAPGTATAPVASMRSTARDPGPPPVGDPLPLRTESWEIGGALAAGVGVTGTARITVSELPGERTAVWLEDVDAVTGAVGAGVEVGLHNGPGLEMDAEAGAELRVHTREGWYVDSEHLPGLLARLGLRELVGAGTLSPGLPAAPGGGLGSHAERATDLLGLSAPEPATTEMLITMGTSAGVTAAVGMPLLGASGAIAHTIGTRGRGNNLSLVLGAELEGSTKIPGGGPSGARSVELEIPLRGGDGSGGGDPQHMVLTSTETVPGGHRLERVVFSYDGDEASGHLRDATRAVGSRDPAGAAAALAALWKDIELQPVWADAVGGVVDDDVESLDVGAALGADLSGSVTGGRRTVTYQR